jgi:tetratricopeptide (TPR) repeat protein
LALLLLIITAASFVYLRPVRVQTLAVLPIAYEGTNADTEYLGEGLTESLINKLSGISTFEVKPLTMVSIYKNQKVDPLQIGRDSKVDLVFLGAITQEQDSMILQTRLIRTKDGSQVFRQEYRLEPSSILELLDNLSGQITSKVQLTLSGDERKLLATRQTINADAYRMYVRGRHFWRKRDKENIQTAISFFEQAIDLDPAYAQAYSGLADCYLILSTVAYGPLPTKEAMSKARFAAETALEIDDTLCEAHTSLGVYQFRHEWNWAEAEREFKQAIRLNPNYSTAYYWYSNLLALMGRSSESIAASEKTKELDPFSPLSDMNLARAYHYARRYDVAADLFRKMLDKNPNDLRTLYMLGYVYERQGLYQESISSLQKVYEKDKLFAAAPLGYVYARAGRRAEALRILNEIEDKSKYPLVPPQEKAIIYLGLDDKDRAFMLLQEACRDRFATLPLLLIEPFLDGIRSDLRFNELARCVNLAQ